MSYAGEKLENSLMFERRYISELMLMASGNVSKAAEIGEMDRKHLHNLLKKHEISRSGFKGPEPDPMKLWAVSAGDGAQFWVAARSCTSATRAVIDQVERDGSSPVDSFSVRFVPSGTDPLAKFPDGTMLGMRAIVRGCKRTTIIADKGVK